MAKEIWVCMNGNHPVKGTYAETSDLSIKLCKNLFPALSRFTVMKVDVAEEAPVDTSNEGGRLLLTETKDFRKG